MSLALRNLKNSFMICISISHSDQVETINAYQPAMVELRMDLIRNEDGSVMDLLIGDPTVIATCRPGEYSDSKRLEILKRLIDKGAAFVDIEIESETAYLEELIAYARSKDAEIIISWHDFERTPDQNELINIQQRCYALGADIAKIACMVNSKEDNARLMSLYNTVGRKVIIGMGELGKITRLAALSLGAEFTFASPDEQHLTAPGQLTFSEFSTLNKLLKLS